MTKNQTMNFVGTYTTIYGKGYCYVIRIEYWVYSLQQKPMRSSKRVQYFYITSYSIYLDYSALIYFFEQNFPRPVNVFFLFYSVFSQ